MYWTGFVSLMSMNLPTSGILFRCRFVRSGSMLFECFEEKVMKNEIYSDCTVDKPPSFFVDRSVRIHEFTADIKTHTLMQFMHALSFGPGQKPFILPDVLCPWRCTEFCFQARPHNLGMFVQHHLRKVVLNLPDRKWY